MKHLQINGKTRMDRKPMARERVRKIVKRIAEKEAEASAARVASRTPAGIRKAELAKAKAKAPVPKAEARAKAATKALASTSNKAKLIKTITGAAKFATKKSVLGTVALTVLPALASRSGGKDYVPTTKPTKQQKDYANARAGITPKKPGPFKTPMTISGQVKTKPKTENNSTSSSTSGGRYRVEKGDTLSGIAKKAGVSLAELKAVNPKASSQKYIFRNTPVNMPKGVAVPKGGYTGSVPYKAPKKTTKTK